MRYVITVEGEVFEVDVGREGRVWVNRHPYDVDLRSVDGRPLYSLLVGHRSYEAHVEEMAGGECQMVMAGRPYRVCFQRRGQQGDREVASLPGSCCTGEVRAPLPGLLVTVGVAVGQQVASGDVVAVLESMKMNLELRTPWSGVVRSVHATPGADLAQGDVVVDVELDAANGEDGAGGCGPVGGTLEP